MHALSAERLALTEQLHRVQRGQIDSVENAEDELDAFMNQNASTLKAEQCGKIATRLTQIKEEISRCSNLLSLVAPVDLNKQKADARVPAAKPVQPTIV